MTRIRPVPSSDGVTLALIDFGGTGHPLLFCHPTGFHGMIWAPLAAHLADVAHGWALDFRGHGDSPPPASMDFGWQGMADDVLAVVDHIGVVDDGDDATDRIGAVGHSMGGTALLLAELRRPGTFSGLWLYEPIMIPRVEGMGPRSNPMAHAARRRRPHFPDRDAAYANFAAKPPLNGLDPAALRAYVDHGLRPGSGGRGGVELKCTPEVEARVFEGSVSHDAFDRLGDVQAPVTVAVGGDGGLPAQVGALVAEALPHGRLERYPELTHFGPLEDLPGIADAIRRALW